MKIVIKNIEKIKNLRDYEYSLLKSILKKDYNISNCTIKYNKNGKPYLDDINNIYFSMSHSDKYLVIVISNKEIGVDIEEVKKYNTKINDILNIKPKNEEEFFRYWTKKEAIIKLKGLALKDINDVDESNVKFYIKKYKNCLITVAEEI